MRKYIKVIIQGGYSEKMLQPCYLIGIGIIFLLTPAIGLFWSSVVVLAPAFYIAAKVFKALERNGLLKQVVDNFRPFSISYKDAKLILNKYKYCINPDILLDNLDINFIEAIVFAERLIESDIATLRDAECVNTELPVKEESAELPQHYTAAIFLRV